MKPYTNKKFYENVQNNQKNIQTVTIRNTNNFLLRKYSRQYPRQEMYQAAWKPQSQAQQLNPSS